jgi:opacity protein-like surface antigen
VQKITKILAAGVIVAFSSGVAAADEGYYMGAYGAGSIIPDVEGRFSSSTTDRTLEFDPAYGAVLEAGYRFDKISVSLTGGYRSLEIDGVSSATNVSGDGDLYTAMMNVGYNFETKSAFKPFVNAGAGLVVIDGNVSFTDTADNNASASGTGTIYAPGFRAGLGVDYALAEQIDLSLAYDFMFAFDGEVDNIFGSTKEDAVIHSILVGLKYSF